MKCAGVFFRTDKGTALFLKRGNDGDFPGFWDFPGGHAEEGETAEACAVRECREETDVTPKNLVLHTRMRAGDGRGIANAATGQMPPPGASAEAAPILPADLDFTTFLCDVADEFVPRLNSEHIGYAWAPVGAPPEPLHPGCRIALDRLNMDELGVARAIADGRLTSPQHYKNVWLFAIRITGTDIAYRKALDEYVYRSPDNYLTEDFLARCNGLPVIFLRRSGDSKLFHPKAALLDSKEFAERIVGTVFLPYIAGSEVWAVAKIWDDAAAAIMAEDGMSTSPSVWFKSPAQDNISTKLENGSTLLFEGKPGLLDHVAICEVGVWDKGNEPTGVRSESRGDSNMAEETDKEKEMKEDAAKKDAHRDDAKKDDAAKKDARKDDDGDKLDKIADALKGLSKRMDAFEEERKSEKADAGKRDDAHRDDTKRKDEEDKKEREEPEETVADAKRKDAKRKDDEKDDDSKDDAKRKDAKRDDAHRDDMHRDDRHRDDAAKRADAQSEQIKGLQKRIDELSAKIPVHHTDKDRDALTDAQVRADDAFQAFGQRAPIPLPQETAATYERRCVRLLKEHSPTWKNVETGQAFADDASFGIVRDQIYAEAKKTGLDPVNVAPGQLRGISRQSNGHTVTEFHGDPGSWMNDFAGHVKLKAQGPWKHEDLGARK